MIADLLAPLLDLLGLPLVAFLLMIIITLLILKG